MVLVYHLYPDVLPGGYIGVDVFFVISGFLITGHLASRFARTGKVRLLEFYGRRARRLLPAAVLVLVVTWVAARLLLPLTQQPAAASQVRASALYVENWVLASNSVDYLAAQEAPSPVQHYWSLSVEEQFYLIWPLLFVAAAAVAARYALRGPARRAGLRVAAVLALMIVGGSLWYSVHETATNPAAAYFITPTRLWELGVGGALALFYPTISRLIGRVGLLGWAGLAMVIGSGFALSGSSAFPGWVAVIPTVGCALLIASGSTGARWSPAVLFARRPAVFIGDISYGIYLWHWPLVVLWLAYSGGSIGLLDGPVIAGASVLLAWLTKIAVEDPIRRARWASAHPGRSLATATAAAVPVLLTTVFLLQQPGIGTARADAAHPGAVALADQVAGHASQVAGATSQPSAASSSPPSSAAPSAAPVSSSAPASSSAVPSASATRSSSPPHPSSTSLSATVPPVAQAPDDMPLANRDDCKAQLGESKLVSCTAGDRTDPQLTVALVGDSFAAQWSSALADIGTKEHWKLVTVTHDGCAFTATMMTWENKPYTACNQWGRSALDYLLNTVRPDVVIVSSLPGRTIPGHPTYDAASRDAIANGMEQYWRRLADSGAYVVGIKPTPSMGLNIPDCLSSRTGSVAKCTVPRSRAVFATSSIQLAAAALGPQKATEIDMNDFICGATQCKPVVGNVVVYRDKKHLTRTYTMTLVPYLKNALLEIPAMRA